MLNCGPSAVYWVLRSTKLRYGGFSLSQKCGESILSRNFVYLGLSLSIVKSYMADEEARSATDDMSDVSRRSPAPSEGVDYDPEHLLAQDEDAHWEEFPAAKSWDVSSPRVFFSRGVGGQPRRHRDASVGRASGCHLPPSSARDAPLALSWCSTAHGEDVQPFNTYQVVPAEGT